MGIGELKNRGIGEYFINSSVLSFVLSLLLATACGPLPKDYDAIATCGNRGFKVGTEEYEDCVSSESRANLLDKHRAEIERRHQQEERESIFRRAF